MREILDFNLYSQKRKTVLVYILYQHDQQLLYHGRPVFDILSFTVDCYHGLHLLPYLT